MVGFSKWVIVPLTAIKEGRAMTQLTPTKPKRKIVRVKPEDLVIRPKYRAQPSDDQIVLALMSTIVTEYSRLKAIVEE